MKDVLSCKYCGTVSGVEVFAHGMNTGPYQVVHNTCGCWGPCCSDEEKAVEGWNIIMAIEGGAK